MRRPLAIAAGVVSIIGLASIADAISIESAEIQNGAAYVDGNKAATNATITWEGVTVTTANRNGEFSFSAGAVPDDCVGALSDGISAINVTLANCAPKSQGAIGVLCAFIGLIVLAILISDDGSGQPLEG